MANGQKTGGRKTGTPNKKTKDLLELMGDYNPFTSLLNIAQDKTTPLDMQVKINLDLMSYIYPKRKAVQITENSKLEVNQPIKIDEKIVIDVMNKLKNI